MMFGSKAHEFIVLISARQSIFPQQFRRKFISCRSEAFISVFLYCPTTYFIFGRPPYRNQHIKSVVSKLPQTSYVDFCTAELLLKVEVNKCTYL